MEENGHHKGWAYPSKAIGLSILSTQQVVCRKEAGRDDIKERTEKNPTFKGVTSRGKFLPCISSKVNAAANLSKKQVRYFFPSITVINWFVIHFNLSSA